MVRYLLPAAGLLFLAAAAIYLLAPDATVAVGNASGAQKNVTKTAPPRNVSAECLIDLDCGQDGYTDFFCWEGFVVRDYLKFRCYETLTGDYRCNKSFEREAIQLCRDDEMCVEKKERCQPMSSCGDGKKNWGETGIDCGGPCKPCNYCNNDVMDGDEEGVDCGGRLCPGCEVACARNESCGMPRWSKPYCGKDMDGIDIVYRDYLAYVCRNPGTYGSHCDRSDLIRRVSDYCGPLKFCRDGICYDNKNPDLPTPSDPTRWNAPANFDGEPYTTCIGGWCYKVKKPPE